MLWEDRIEDEIKSVFFLFFGFKIIKNNCFKYNIIFGYEMYVFFISLIRIRIKIGRKFFDRFFLWN